MTAGLGGGIWHRGGIPWYGRRRPFRWHRCRLDSLIEEMSVDGPRDVVEHCACGAWRPQAAGGAWRDKNSRRKTSISVWEM